MTIMIWDVASGRYLHRLRGHTSSVWSIAFSPDGNTLASGSPDRSIRLWDVATGTEIGQPLIGHTDFVRSVAFSPDGRLLASGSSDKTIILWDVEGHQPIGSPLRGHTDFVRSVAFNPDGNALISGSGDGTLLIWDLDVAVWRDRACALVGRNLTRDEWETYQPDLPYHPGCLQQPIDGDVMEQVVAIVQQTVESGDPARAEGIMAETLEWVLQTDSETLNNNLCWNGSLTGYSELLVPACDRAVELAPERGQYYTRDFYRDTRGLARALNGDMPGAIADFRAFIAWSEANQPFEELRQWRAEWIAALEAGQNPFDAATLEKLRDEENYVGMLALPYNEDFATPNDEWDVGSTNQGKIAYADGQYLVRATRNNATIIGDPNKFFTRVAIEFELTAQRWDAQSWGGLVFHGVPRGYHVAVLYGNGTATILKSVDGELLQLAPPTPVPFRRNGANLLRVESYNGTITLFVNGEIVSEYRDTDLTYGNIGLAVRKSSGGDFEVAFDNLRVTELP